MQCNARSHTHCMQVYASVFTCVRACSAAHAVKYASVSIYIHICSAYGAVSEHSALRSCDLEGHTRAACKWDNAFACVCTPRARRHLVWVDICEHWVDICEEGYQACVQAWKNKPGYQACAHASGKEASSSCLVSTARVPGQGCVARL
eukprot:1154605-Pelagomonas_calceolata.AAC.7